MNGRGFRSRTGHVVQRLTVATAILSGTVAVGILGPGPGTAQADAWGNHQWCPGDALPQSDAPITWDMTVCHNWYYQSVRDGAPSLYHVIEGVYASPCPPLAYMCP